MSLNTRVEVESTLWGEKNTRKLKCSGPKEIILNSFQSTLCHAKTLDLQIEMFLNIFLFNPQSCLICNSWTSCVYHRRTVPKVYRKVKASEHKSRKVFGVPLLQSVQRSGKPLPPSILRAMEYLKTECLDQVRSSIHPTGLKVTPEKESFALSRRSIGLFLGSWGVMS